MKFPVQGRPAKQNPIAAWKHSKMGSQEHLYLTQMDLNLYMEECACNGQGCLHEPAAFH